MGVFQNAMKSTTDHSFKKIDDSQKYVEDLIKNGTTIIDAVKRDDSRVIARKGIPGEKIETFTAKGLEMVDTIKVDDKGRPDYVVTMADKNGNPIVIDDEGHYNSYINTAEFFEKDKEHIGNGVYRQIPSPRKFVEIPEDIIISCSWDPEMRLHKGDLLNITDMNNIYGIERSAFETTHAITSDPKPTSKGTEFDDIISNPNTTSESISFD